jgi:NAD(P)-dependent dehydrogenase (short-subunit alcohol dehydrogenase family)
MEPRIDVLVNNAGAVFAHREITAEGNERTFATNHLACFVLTQGLLPRLLASAPARIVTTSSIAHQRATLDFADLQSVRHYGGIRAYSRSKLCNILFTRELARRLSGTGVTATCLHPGFVASRFGDASGGVLREIIAVGKRLLAISPEKGARTLIWLATAPEAASESGGYYYKCRRVTPSAAAQDAVAAERLWAESERLVSAVSP